MGWTPFFQQQLSLDEWETFNLGRVVAQHRAHIDVMTEQSERVSLAVMHGMNDLTVGDWILFDNAGHFERRLERTSLFSRKSAGSKVDIQRIAANVNTVFVVCSLNNNFNLSRIERYLALANEAGVEPVVVLTKADCSDEPQAYIEQVRTLDPMLMVEAVNSLDAASVKPLQSWCTNGKTVAFMGSSGVGKSTLVNTLMGNAEQDTGSAREQDSRGRHTTTSRSIHLLPSGGLLLDTPGMRELQLADCEDGINQTFSQITELAASCKFGDCQHQSEPGCAVQAAIRSGELDERRLANYFKLLREQARNGATLAQKRDKDRQLHKMYRNATTAKRHSKSLG
jgi:ribosome biogenesis GTPase